MLGAHAMVLHLDVHAASLAALHQALAVDCSVFITAYNPHSQAVDAPANIQHQSELSDVLKARGLVVFQRIGEHPGGKWAGEPSFLVPGIALDEARALGRHFLQNAVVWSGADATPRLILLR